MKVWYDPNRDLGGSTYATHGFIYPDAKDSLPGGVLGLNADLFREYVQHIADRRLAAEDLLAVDAVLVAVAHRIAQALEDHDAAAFAAHVAVGAVVEGPAAAGGGQHLGLHDDLPDVVGDEHVDDAFGDPGLERERERLGEIGDLEPLHHVAAMHLDGAQADAEPGGELLVRFAGEQPLQHLALPRGQLIDPLACHAAALAARLAFLEHVERLVEAGEQRLLGERLLDEVDRALLHGAHRGRHLAMPGHHDHRPVDAALLELRHHLEAVHLRHADVEQHAARLEIGQRLEKITTGTERIRADLGGA